jgi:glutamine amidotransferase
MTGPEITIIDYGVGNILSVKRGLEHCGAQVKVTADPDRVIEADRVVLPGVGAFANSMQALQERGLVEAIKELANRNTPLLGICLGMQLLLDESEEMGLTKGLGLIPGRVVPLPAKALGGERQKIPHIGWSGLIPAKACISWNATVLEHNTPNQAAYFVHSYMAVTADPAAQIADCKYGGHRVAAVISKNRITGCQFHPEKSGEVGLKILSKFIWQ